MSSKFTVHFVAAGLTTSQHDDQTLPSSPVGLCNRNMSSLTTSQSKLPPFVEGITMQLKCQCQHH